MEATGMFEANELLRKTEEGSFPARWRVFRTPKTLPLIRGLQALSLGLLALGLFGGISLRIGWLPWSSPLWGLFAGIVVFVGMMVGRMVAVQAKYSCLVITPDGFVQRTGRSARSIFAVAYRDLAGMKIDVDARKRPRHNCSPVYDQHYARQVKITLRLFL